MAALSYEVLWARMLSLQFGVSIFGIVVTVSAFMTGLGGGSLLGARFVQTLRNPLLILALLEVAVALFAWFTPQLFQAIDLWIGMSAEDGGLLQWYGLQGLVVFLVLFIPAFALGLGFPMVLAMIVDSDVSLSKAYALNTLGGALGALVPLGLLPLFGWTVSIRLVAILGFTVALMIFLLSRGTKAIPCEENGSHTTTQWLASRYLLAYAGIGAAALILQVAWTRLFGMILLRTEYVLAVMLAIFLVGIALGSALVRRHSSSNWLSLLPVIAATFAVLTLWGLPYLAEWAEDAQYQSLFDALWRQSLILALLTLPVTLALGAWLPLLVAYHQSGEQSQSRSVGAQLYGANSLGAALGALATGFILLPLIGAPGTIILAGVMLFVCGMTWVQSSRLWLTGLLVIALATPVIHLPAVNVLLPQTQVGTEDLYRHEDAVSITHVIERQDGQRLLLGDLQRMDASSDPAAVVAQMNQARLPLLLHPAPSSVLFLGIGTGISAAGSLPYPGLMRTGVELSQGAIDAASELFEPVNGGVMQQMTIVRDDARRFLRADGDQYDVIIGDLFHPDLVGRSALLSVQQFERASERLSDGGLFVQWLALNQFDARSLSIVLRSFEQIFPQAMLFIDGFRVGMVGPKGEFGGAPAVLANLKRLSVEQQAAATGGEGGWTWLGRFWGQINEGQGVVQDEWAPQLEYALPRLRFSDGGALPQLLASLLNKRPSLDEAVTLLQIADDQREQFERSYVATGLAVQGWLASIQGDSSEAQRLIRFAYEANPQDHWIGFDLADAMWQTFSGMMAQGRDERQSLQAILQVRPDHEMALKAMWQLELREGNVVQAEEYRMQIKAISPLGRDI
ncbi:MAG: fused MFS/spermidine synthase [Gammaproteobacteria bacterium]|nr:fused MFS/spermidine synthase [Gammaproteobacteria bacterium]